MVINKGITFHLSFIFSHNLLVLSEFRRRRHGWAWRSNQWPSQFLSQLINKSAGDLANDTLKQVVKRNATGPGKVSAAPRRVLSPRCLCSVQAHCEFGAAAAALALFPSAAAPHCLFKTGYGANNFQREHSYSTFLKKIKTKNIGWEVGVQMRPFILVRSASWPGFWPSACANYTNCTPRPPWSEREEEPGDVGLAPQPHKMGTDERIDSMHLRI